MGIIAGTADPKLAAGGKHCLNRHLVTRQGAGIVGTDHRDPTQRLYGGQAPYDDIAPCHPLYADRQRNRHDGRQAFRNSGDRQAYGGHEHVGRRISTEHDAENKGCQRQYGNGYRQKMRKTGHLTQQGGRQGLDLTQHLADAADLGGIRGHRDYAIALAVGCERT